MHQTALASHYNNDAVHYDTFNEKNSKVINKTLEKILTKHKVTTVLDITCGTGSQVFWLTKCGFKVVGSDINARMLAVAKKKALAQNLVIKFIKNDMRDVKAGKFDAVIAIFNAIGHLTVKDFAKAIKNAAHNLNDNGLLVFDIFNADYLRHKDNITTFTIDWLKPITEGSTRVIQYSTIDDKAIMASYTTEYTQIGHSKPKISHSTQTLQVYSASELSDLLSENGFKVIDQCGIDGKKFKRLKTDRILTVARKK